MRKGAGFAYSVGEEVTVLTIVLISAPEDSHSSCARLHYCLSRVSVILKARWDNCTEHNVRICSPSQPPAMCVWGLRASSPVPSLLRTLGVGADNMASLSVVCNLRAQRPPMHRRAGDCLAQREAEEAVSANPQCRASRWKQDEVSKESQTAGIEV